jgi:hypothetical protein
MLDSRVRVRKVDARWGYDSVPNLLQRAVNPECIGSRAGRLTVRMPV